MNSFNKPQLHLHTPSGVFAIEIDFCYNAGALEKRGKKITMGEISIISEKEGFTNISNIFIEYYMTDANGDFVKLYLYLAMLCSTGRKILISDIADALNCTEKDICRGIKYWIKEDAISLRYNDDKEIVGIVLKTLQSPDPDLSSQLKVVDLKFESETKKSAQKAQSVSIQKDEHEESNNVQEEQLRAPRKKQPTPETLMGMQRDPEIKNLISEAEAYCNRDLSQKELNSLIYIKDQLGFSFDLCEYLLEYCAGIKKTSFNYIEKVAKNWYEEGITNRTDAEEYTDRFLTLYTKILKTLGITNRISPAPVEKQFINTWTNEYDFSDTIIIEACNRAITQKPNDATFPYVNGILQSWHKSRVHSMADIAALDEKHAMKKMATPVGVSSNQESLDQLKAIENMYLRKGSNQ